MKLRSGKETKPPIVDCISCKEFYGNPEWNNKCSACVDRKKLGLPDFVPFDSKKFQEKLQNFVKEKLITQDYYHALEHAAGRISTVLLRCVLNELKNKEKFITAKQGKKLIRDLGVDTTEKSELVCQFIIDWWNITNKNGFTSREVCYFGNFNEPPEPKFPPRLPNYSGYRKYSRHLW